MNIILDNLQATAQIGPHNHGIKLLIEGNKREYYSVSQYDKLSIDIQGPVLSYLPAGLGSLANLFLPYDIQQKKLKYHERQMNCEFELAQGQLSEKTLMKNLEEIIKSGDPYFYIEIIHDNLNTLCVFPTKCSLIKESIKSQGKADIIYREDNIPKFKLRSNVYGYFRWLLLAFFYMFAIWAMAYDLETVDKLIPIKYFSKNKANVSTIIDVLPPYPKNKTEAYFFEMEQKNNHAAMEEILQKSTALAQRKKKVTWDELKLVEQTIREEEQKKGLVKRVLGFFSFINLLWLASIIGITITIGPFIYLLLKPLQQFFQDLFIKFFTKIVIPTVEFLHRIGAFEWFGYALCLFFILEGMRVNPEYGFYISFTGIALQIPAFLYSTLIHSKKIRASKNQEKLYELINYWALLCWIPLVILNFYLLFLKTIHFNSTLLGYITLISIYSVLGFSFDCFGLCYYIGFDNDKALIRVVICSFFGMIIYACLKTAGIPENLLSPYLSAINVLGSFTMFLGLLIVSSRWYNRSRYGIGNLLMIFALICCIFFGFVFGMDGMKNTAIVFLVLFALEKYTETHFENSWNPWFYFFIFSILMWRAALYLHTHPEYIVSLFKTFS